MCSRDLEVDEHEIGDVIGAERLLFEHRRERVALEALKESGGAEARGAGDVAAYPPTTGVLPVTFGGQRLQRRRHRAAGRIRLQPPASRAA